MPLVPRLFSLRRNLFDKLRVEQDLDEELRAYLEQLTDEKIRSGASHAAARRAALLEIGGVEQVKEEVREIRMGNMLESILHDLRYGFRTLSKNLGFTGVVILALALGIGANTTMFSVAYGILMRPLPYPNADHVALVYMHFSPQNFDRGTMCIADYLDWKAQNHAFEEPSIFSTRRMDLVGTGEPEQVQGALVTAGFFNTMKVPPLLGRVFVPGEDRPGAPSTAVLSESLWRRRFSASPAAIGQAIAVNGSSATIIGVMPDAFRFPRATTELWTNLPVVPPTRRGPFFYRGVARLKPGITIEQAQRETNAIGQRIMRENPYYRNLTLPVERLRDAIVGDVRSPLLVLIGAVGLVLLIAVVNVANLMLARATTREGEMALRLSLGAGRARLVRQLLTESLLLSIAGGAAGLLVSYGGIQLLRSWNPGNLPLIEYVQLDGRALGFMLLTAVVTGLLFGLAPALQGLRANLNSTLKEGGRGARAGAGAARHTRTALVVSEIALSLMLMTGAGLLLRTLQRLQSVTGGFLAAPREILTIGVSPSDRKYSKNDPLRSLYQEILDRARQVPGVEAVAASDSLPPAYQFDADTFMIQGQVLAPNESNPAVSVVTVTSDYFAAMRIPLLKGRFFTTQDRAESAPVTIVSESLARHFFPNKDPIGQHIKQSGPDYKVPYMEVIGVVGDVKYTGLQKDTDDAYYLPHLQSPGRTMFVVARSPRGAAAAPELRRAVQSADRTVTVNQVESLETTLSRAVALPRFDTVLLASFAMVALLLAALGIYGIIAYSVAQRTHEIGVRMALGAGQRCVLGMVIRQGAGLALLGITLGLVGAFALTRLLANLLFGVSSTDPLTFAAVALGLLAVALFASFIPARRATRISPVVALRYE
ncbi:MAG TPA: ABC transporter permease [Bryobacteraceae bacterium]|nr:ABC transporter permease [Bryobacteraceae bacterium]